MHEGQIPIEEIRKKQEQERMFNQQEQRTAQNMCSEKFDPLSSNLQRELQSLLTSRKYSAQEELDRLHQLQLDLNDETVKRVLRVLSIR